MQAYTLLRHTSEFICTYPPVHRERRGERRRKGEGEKEGEEERERNRETERHTHTQTEGEKETETCPPKIYLLIESKNSTT